MKKIILTLSTIAIIFSCEKETKDVVVIGTNENGEELVVNETGDTVVYTAPVTEKDIPEKTQTEGTAIKPEKDGSYQFVFNLKQGQTYPFKIVTTAKNIQSDGQQSMSMNQESTTELAYQVAEVKDNQYVLDVTFKRFAEKMSDGKQSIGFDTNGAAPKDEAAKQRYDFNKAIIGNNFTMTVDKQGKVQNVSNLFKVREKVKNKMQNNLNADQKKILDEFLKAALSEEAMKQMFEESVAYYPKKSVKPGDTWSRNESEGSAKSDVTYTFDGVKGDVATIKITGTSSGTDSQTDPNGSGLKIFRSLEGKVNGTVNINKNSGWIENATMTKDETVRVTQQLGEKKANFSSQTKSTTKIN